MHGFGVDVRGGVRGLAVRQPYSPRPAPARAVQPVTAPFSDRSGPLQNMLSGGGCGSSRVYVHVGFELPPSQSPAGVAAVSLAGAPGGLPPSDAQTVTNIVAPLKTPPLRPSSACAAGARTPASTTAAAAARLSGAGLRPG